jgi:anti-sigma regulatory factor (Ser/Thr protein kinase)
LVSQVVKVDDNTRVAEVRRLAVTRAQAEGVDGHRSEEVAIVATEIATNLLKHARSGEVHIAALSNLGEPGVEILSVDRGPGTANWPACLADGFSTVGTAGTGLGAISRLSDVCDSYSQPGRGTVLVARKYAAANRNSGAETWKLGAVTVPHPGETVCGDAWSARRHPSHTTLIVADGLGHGILASDASLAAIRSFQKGTEHLPAAVLQKVHLALRATRGAAVAVCHIEHEGRRIRYAGLGNIAGVLLGGARARFMISHNGTAGLEASRFQEFEYAIPEDGAIVMHSDGLTTNWSVEPYPGLLRRHPSVIAGTLYRDASRGRDDVCVLVGRWMRE